MRLSLVPAIAALMAIAAPTRADVCTVYSNGRQIVCSAPTPQCHFNPGRQEWFCTPRGAVACGSINASRACSPGFPHRRRHDSAALPPGPLDTNAPSLRREHAFV